MGVSIGVGLSLVQAGRLWSRMALSPIGEIADAVKKFRALGVSGERARFGLQALADGINVRPCQQCQQCQPFWTQKGRRKKGRRSRY